MARFVEPVTLAGDHAVLEPMTREHVPALREACADGELWQLWYTSVPRPEAMAAYVETALASRDEGKAMPFVVRERASGGIVGSTRYMNVDATNRRLEIGTTWYARRVQRTAVNTECKRLLLAHAFEQLHCIAVEFRTSWFNHASQRAIERLGAKRDGVLRSHMLHADGTLRDTVVYSIVAAEWPGVRSHLDHLLGRER
jgi:RimJ/RimL family protein N-acetyltransferase